jgi:hypothetical protein
VWASEGEDWPRPRSALPDKGYAMPKCRHADGDPTFYLIIWQAVTSLISWVQQRGFRHEENLLISRVWGSPWPSFPAVFAYAM